ncbi:MAG: tetratricopeptide repeat protein [Pirellula sp.]
MKPIRSNQYHFVCTVSIGMLAMIAIGCESKSKKQSGNSSQTPTTLTQKNEEPGKKTTSLRALKLLEAGRFDEAWEECQKVLLATPNDARAIYVSAQVLSQRGKLEQALAMIDRIDVAEP